MKNYTLRVMRSLVLLCFFVSGGQIVSANSGNISPPEADSLMLFHWVENTQKEIKELRTVYEARNLDIQAALWHNALALQSKEERTAAEQVLLLQEKLDLQDQLQANEMFLEGNGLKIRYRKGIDLIKLLYEKILALDHHFTGMQTYQNVILLSNPHTYPEFAKAQSVLERNMRKRNAVSMPGILQSNPFLSATFSVVGTMLGDGTSREKQEELDNISCILDFTVRMNSDLSIIQHETEYLKTANKNLKEECEKLFSDYTKVIGYLVPLENCRQNDDWETLREKLDIFVAQIQGDNGNSGQQNNNYGSNSGGYGSGSGGYNSGNGGYGSSSNSGYGSGSGYGSSGNTYGGNSGGYASSGSSYGNNSGGYGSSSGGYNSGGSGYGSGTYGSGYNNANTGYGGNTYNSNSGGGNTAPVGGMSPREAERRRVDLEFSTQRVAEFITQYQNFITQGTQYYQKFDNIVSSYANEDACETKLPRQFGELKYDIKSTIEKFTNTYNLPEIQGSRLKALLYGTADR